MCALRVDVQHAALAAAPAEQLQGSEQQLPPDALASVVFSHREFDDCGLSATAGENGVAQ
jgi:hypothetical protein